MVISKVEMVTNIKEELSDVELWQKSEDERLEYEGYCNKIRKGLEDLDEKVENELYGNLSRTHVI